MPLDHVSTTVPLDKFEDLIKWLLVANEHLGFKEVLRVGNYIIGMGEGNHPYFFLYGDSQLKETPEIKRQWELEHIAFLAPDVESVKKWYENAIKAGGKDNGAPGPRPEYQPDYYGAFVRDPYCGINFEAVSYTWKP